MNILVVGNGWVGKKMFDELVIRGHMTAMASHTTVLETIRGSGNQIPLNGYHWVVNCAGVTGYPNVDACELNKTETYEGNGIFPILLQHECKKKSIKLAHFSSGCIYQGEITDVNADPNYFGSIYSVSKGVSDLSLKDKALVFRIRMPFTGVDEPKNYLTKVYNYAKTGKLVDFGPNSLTDLNEAVKLACKLIEKGDIGPVNLVNSNSIDMHELANLMGIDPGWYTAEEFARVARAGRSTCVIPAHPEMSDVREALTKAIAAMKA